MAGPWDTVSAFRRYKNMPPDKKSRYITAKTKGWSKEKHEMMSRVAQKAALTLEEDRIDEIRQLRKRQSKIARKLYEKGEKSLKYHQPDSLDAARKLIVSGLQEERAAQGVTGKGGAQSLTQVNVNLPKTRFDEMIDAKDFSGVLGFVEDVERERARRSKTGVAGKGKAKAK